MRCHLSTPRQTVMMDATTIATINGGSIRRFDLHVQRALHCFKLDLKDVSLVQLQSMQIGSVHPFDIQQIGVRIFDTVTCEAFLIVKEQK